MFNLCGSTPSERRPLFTVTIHHPHAHHHSGTIIFHRNPDHLFYPTDIPQPRPTRLNLSHIFYIKLNTKLLGKAPHRRSPVTEGKGMPLSSHDLYFPFSHKN